MLRRCSPQLIAVRSHSIEATHKGLLGPATRLLVHHYQLNPSTIPGSGPKNKNLLKHDVLDFIKRGNLTPAPVHHVSVGASVAPQRPVQTLQRPDIPVSSFVDIPLTNMRQAIAKRLSLSKRTIPHAYVRASLPADTLDVLRQTFTKAGQKVSVNDLLIKLCGAALCAVPGVNVQFKDGQIVPVSSVDISVAVATPDGLITPIIFNADQLPVSQIAANVRELAGRARQNQLKPNEFQGGSFTISNLGMFGISHFTAIINPPQAAILAVGKSETSLNADLQTVQTMTVTLCYDARAISDRTAQEFVRYLEAAAAQPEAIVGFASASALDFDFSRLL